MIETLKQWLGQLYGSSVDFLATPPMGRICVATALLAFGLWMILPPRRRVSRAVGFVFSAIGIGFFVSAIPGITDHLTQAALFWILAAVSIVAGVAMISSRNPVYSALWFAMVLLGVAGLFLFQGAQFLGIATVVVYAGAIVVTFLFVLMLAQPDGSAWYDRVNWGSGPTLISVLTGSMMIAVLTITIISEPTEEDKKLADGKKTDATETDYSNVSVRYLEKPMNEKKETDQHVAQLGGALFSEYLLAVEIVGSLMLVALVGAIAILSHGKPNTEIKPLTDLPDNEGEMQ